MKKLLLLLLFVPLVISCSEEVDKNVSSKKDSQLMPVAFNQVHLEDDFWKTRLKTQGKTLVPFALDKTIPAVKNLEKAAKFLEGDTTDLPYPHQYLSSDLYKVMEGAALILMENPNPELEKRIDGIVDIIARAQQEDGYLYVAHTTGVSKNHDAWGGSGMGDKPYSFVLHSHELYNMGHMYEAAVAYYQATGKDKWLKVAEKNAQHINRVFFEGDPNYNNGTPVNQAPGHEEIELALIKLYRVTGNELYLNMSKKFLDIRGKTYNPEGSGLLSPIYSQQHKPVAEQEKAVGHAVRAVYLYSGMADVSLLTGTGEYDGALNNIWHNIVDTKMHITGGLGAVHGIEGFGPEYVLPNKEAYNETCAAVGNVFFNYRMFLLTKDAQFMDVAEISLLNNSLAGVNIEGNKFFYVNPLEADGNNPFNHGKTGRSPWFGTACCPSNIARLIPQVSGMMYSYTENEIYATFYASNSTNIPLKEGIVSITQKSGYPFDEKINFTLTPEKKQKFTLKLRIPTWARNQFVPGKLYSYIGNISEEWQVKVNGEKVSVSLDKGFAIINRTWQPGDEVELMLPMPVRFNKSIDLVEANESRVAITRGPLVYCAEEVDNSGVVQQFFLDDINQSRVNTQIISEGVLKNVTSISLESKSNGTSGIKKEKLKLIPYYAWNNRGDESMIVWFPTKSDMIQFSDVNGLKGGRYKNVKASSTSKYGNLGAISDGRRPMNSNDTTIPVWTSTKKDNKHWVEIGIDSDKPIRSINIYWYDNNKSIKVPEKWSIEYLKDNTWKKLKIYVTDSYFIQKNQYNLVHPAEKLKCKALRINIIPNDGMAIGILDVDIQYEDIEM